MSAPSPGIRKRQPVWIDPMLATLTEERFSDSDWIFEKKLDGVRGLAFFNGKDVRLLSRNQLSFNSSYPDIVQQLRSQPASNFISDGEIVALEKGVSSFSKLQQRMRSTVEAYYYVFDLLYLNGHDLRHLPLLERKRILKTSLAFSQPAAQGGRRSGTGWRIRYSTHRVGEGEAYFEQACRENWEGIIAKRAGSSYVSGRSRDWLKFKCSRQQEFVIVGYTDPEGQRTGFGALLVGYYSGKDLIYAGKVGTGYTIQTLNTLTKLLSGMERQTPAVKGIGLPRKKVHWIEPKVVAQVAFSEWTDDGKLRHPRFLGIREDKKPRDVVRE